MRLRNELIILPTIDASHYFKQSCHVERFAEMVVHASLHPPSEANRILTTQCFSSQTPNLGLFVAQEEEEEEEEDDSTRKGKICQ